MIRAKARARSAQKALRHVIAARFAQDDSRGLRSHDVLWCCVAKHVNIQCSMCSCVYIAKQNA